MKASKIASEEEKFSEKLTNTSRVKYKEIETVSIGNSTIRKIRPNFDSYYYKTEKKKDAIVLHYTVGTLRADLATITQKDNKMSVPYVIARSGEIYEIFDPKYWSYHLGRGTIGGNQTNSQRTIGIELSNYGPLTKNGDNLETIYSQVEYKDSEGNTKKTKKDVYCSLSEAEYYTVVEGGFRGREYFASYTQEQYDALNDLIEYLCEEFDIPKEFVPEEDRFKTFKTSNEAKSFKGIATHVNFRKSGKWDIGPDFAWEKIIPEDEIEMELEEVTIESLTEPKVSEEVAEEIPETVIEEVVEEKPKKKFSWISFILKLFGK